MRRILVAMDDSEASERVAAFVNAFFDGVDAELLVVSVARTTLPWMPPGVAYGGVAAWPGPASAEAFQVSQEVSDEEARRAAVGSGVDDAEALVTSGDPVAAILRAAGERDVELVVVGSSHKGFLERAMKGSVSEDLVREGSVPVLVVP